jgi:N4-gp56 family major capsid protein
MPLAIDQLVAKAITQTSGQAAIIPELWAAELEPNLRKREVLQQSVLQNTDLLGEPGDVVHIPTLPDLGAAAALTEGTDMTVGQLTDSTTVDLTPAEVGKAVGITRKALDRIKYDGMAAIVDRLAYSMALYLEGTIAGLYNATVPVVGGSLTNQYPNSHASGTVVSTDTLDATTILHAKATLEASDVTPWEDGLWRFYIHPYQYEKLIQDQDVRNDLRYASPSTLLRGEVGVLHNTRIIVSTHVKSVTENSTTVYKSLFVSPRWAAIAWKRKPELVIDPTLYDFGRRRQVAVTADLDIQLLHNDRALVVTTA